MENAMQTLSIQKLREQLPEIINAVENGASYTLIYRSRPIGQLVPLDIHRQPPSSKKRGRRFESLINPEAPLLFKSRKRSVALIRDDR